MTGLFFLAGLWVGIALHAFGTGQYEMKITDALHKNVVARRHLREAKAAERETRSRLLWVAQHDKEISSL